MSQLSVNTIQPRTGASVEIAGLDSPTHGGAPLAKKNEVVVKAGDTGVGPIALAANAVLPLQVPTLQQVVPKEGGVANEMTGPLFLAPVAYPAVSAPILTGSLEMPRPSEEPLRAVHRHYFHTELNKITNNVANSSYGATSGYQTLPGGFKIQWAQHGFGDVPAGTPGSQASVTFPSPFVSVCFSVQVTLLATAGQLNNLSAAVTGWSLTGADIQIQEWSAGSNPVTVLVLAIGV